MNDFSIKTIKCRPEYDVYKIQAYIKDTLGVRYSKFLHDLKFNHIDDAMSRLGADIKTLPSEEVLLKVIKEINKSQTDILFSSISSFISIDTDITQVSRPTLILATIVFYYIHWTKCVAGGYYENYLHKLLKA